MLTFALTLALHAGPFPLPAIDGKALAVTEKQKTFRLPMRFENVRAFYDRELGKEKDVSMKLTGSPGQRTLALTSRRKGDRWTKATVKEAELMTVLEVTPVIELQATDVTGQAVPLVQFVFERSREVEKALSTTADPLVR